VQKNEIKRKTNVLYKKAYAIAHLRPRVSQERWAWRDETDAAGCPGQTGQSCFAPPTLSVASKLQTNHNTTRLVNNECHKQTGNPMRMLTLSLSAISVLLFFNHCHYVSLYHLYCLCLSPIYRLNCTNVFGWGTAIVGTILYKLLSVKYIFFKTFSVELHKFFRTVDDIVFESFKNNVL